MHSPAEIKTTPIQNASPSRSSRYARACMMCGAALIAWSIIAPMGTLVSNTLQSRGADGTAQNAVEIVGPVVTAPPENAAPAPQHSVVPSTGTATPADISSSSPFQPKPQMTQQRILKENGPANTSKMIATQKDRVEILDLYKTWKAAWQTRDVDGIMKLYSLQIRFRSLGTERYNHTRLRRWFEQLWEAGKYTINDVGQPHLRIKGDHALLIAGQNYSRRGRMQFTNRYVLRREVVKGNVAGAPDSIRQWRIVEEDYLPFEGSTDVQAQIY